MLLLITITAENYTPRSLLVSFKADRRDRPRQVRESEMAAENLEVFCAGQSQRIGERGDGTKQQVGVAKGCKDQEV